MSRRVLRSLRGTTARRAAAFLLLVSFGLAPLWQAAHLLLVPHATCPEDGALVEAAPLAPAQRAESRGWRASARFALGDRHEHGHCEVVSSRSLTTARLESRAKPAIAGERTLLGFAPEERSPPRAIALLRLAPKGSPPAVAAQPG
jgi:hypothetical protein